MNLFSREHLNRNAAPQDAREGKKIPLWAKGYYSMYDGYLITESRSASGRQVYEYRYAAEVYSSGHSRAQERREKLSCMALIALSAVLFCIGAVQFIPANTLWFVTLPQAAYIALCAMSFLAACRCLASPEQLTRYSYRKGAVRLQKYPRYAAALMAVTALLTAACQLFHTVNAGVRGFAAAGLYTLSALAMYAVYRMESARHYKAENKTVELDEGTQVVRQIGEFTFLASVEE